MRHKQLQRRTPYGKTASSWTNLLYILPMLAVICVFIIAPLMEAFRLSFYNVKVSGEEVFIGLQNYISFFNSTDGALAWKNTAIWVIGGTLLKIAIGLLIALVLYQNFKGKRAMTAITLIPYAMPAAVSCMVWRLMYHPVYGHINQILMNLGILDRPVSFLGSIDTSLISVMMVNVWAVAPFCALNILASLYSIPTYIYEAADIDGAGAFRKFFKITLPLIFSDVKTLALLIGIWGFNSFDAIYIMTTGGPANSSSILVNQVYQYAFEFNNRGYSAAISVICFLVLSLFAFFYVRSKGKEVSYE